MLVRLSKGVMKVQEGFVQVYKEVLRGLMTVLGSSGFQN